MIRYIELEGQIFEYELFRKQVKNLNLRIRTDGRILVSASPQVSVQEIDHFIRQNQAFVFRSLSRLSDLQNQAFFFEERFGNGGKIPLLGKERTLYLQEGKRECACLDGDTIIVTVSDIQDTDNIKKVIRVMLEEYAKRLIPNLCQKTAERFAAYGIDHYTLNFRYMISRWGSCCPATHAITFNKFLICVPLNCIEYVIVHEFIHFFVPNHSSAFYDMFDSMLPTWKTCRDQLAPYGQIIRQL